MSQDWTGQWDWAAEPEQRHVLMYDEEFIQEPEAVYARLRAYGPAAPVELAPGVNAMLVTGYDAALSVMRSPEIFRKDPRTWRTLQEGRVPADSPVLPMMAYRPNCLFTDGEQHARLRVAITDSLDRIEGYRLRAAAERSADMLIDQFSPRGEADVLAEYAMLLPLLVLVDVFGLSDSYGPWLLNDLSRVMDSVNTGEGTATEVNDSYMATLRDMVAFRRTQPGDDVITLLMAHPARLTDEEVANQLALLMAAGTEPITSVIANGIRLLLTDEGFADALTEGSLSVADALDEVLRTDPPLANYAIHYPAFDVDLAGVMLPAHEPVVVSIAAANNDPALVSRDEQFANRAHLTFGAGPHACPARGQAMLVASVAVERLLDRLPDLELAVAAEDLVWRPGPFRRVLRALPVCFTPAPALAQASEPPETGSYSYGRAAPTPPPMSTRDEPGPQAPAPAPTPEPADDEPATPRRRLGLPGVRRRAR